MNEYRREMLEEILELMRGYFMKKRYLRYTKKEMLEKIDKLIPSTWEA